VRQKKGAVVEGKKKRYAGNGGDGTRGRRRCAKNCALGCGESKTKRRKKSTRCSIQPARPNAHRVKGRDSEEGGKLTGFTAAKPQKSWGIRNRQIVFFGDEIECQ